jgi:hypothetical protein
VEGELPQRRSADGAGVIEHRSEIDAAGACHRHRLAGDGAFDLG